MAGFFSWISAMFSRPEPDKIQSEPKLLNSSTIQTEHERAGQLSTNDLEQNLFCWLLDAPPATLGRELDRNAQSVLDILEQRIHRQTLEELPRKPMTLPVLTRALADEKADRKGLTDIILSDPALTDQLLHVANSPMFRVGEKPIESVDQAVFLLGVNGIRNVISAAVMRPMMAARNSREAQFAQKVWRWGLTCARAAEMVARLEKKDGSSYFMTGLMPALSYITLQRELVRICRAADPAVEPSPGLSHKALSRFQWATAQVLASEWQLPPEYHARLMEAERPTPDQTHAPLNDGIIIGTREILRHANQPNMAEDEVLKLVHIRPEHLAQIQRAILDSAKAGSRAGA
jgi:HD-like signal output (HDOD) protein